MKKKNYLFRKCQKSKKFANKGERKEAIKKDYADNKEERKLSVPAGQERQR